MVSVARKITAEEEVLLQTMASAGSGDQKTRKRALAVVTFLQSGDVEAAARAAALSKGTVKKVLQEFDTSGWQALLSVPAPRGGDFLARYDQGFWAERLVRAYLERSVVHRPIPYGTSRSEPFTDLQTFRTYAVNEALLQAWSAGQRWKRPDLLLIPRRLLREKGGTDAWTPDLLHWDNNRCAEFVAAASAAVEVETSLWQVRRATVQLSFTVKDEDLAPLRNWLTATGVPLLIVQVFYDQAYALPFRVFEYLIGPAAPPERHVEAVQDRFTKKLTYSVPLTEGRLLGDIAEPDVEGRVFKAPNGRVTVYGRLVGSKIKAADATAIEELARGRPV